MFSSKALYCSWRGLFAAHGTYYTTIHSLISFCWKESSLDRDGPGSLCWRAKGSAGITRPRQRQDPGTVPGTPGLVVTLPDLQKVQHGTASSTLLKYRLLSFPGHPAGNDHQPTNSCSPPATLHISPFLFCIYLLSLPTSEKRQSLFWLVTAASREPRTEWHTVGILFL